MVLVISLNLLEVTDIFFLLDYFDNALHFSSYFLSLLLYLFKVFPPSFQDPASFLLIVYLSHWELFSCLVVSTATQMPVTHTSMSFTQTLLLSSAPKSQLPNGCLFLDITQGDFITLSQTCKSNEETCFSLMHRLGE